ncbi:Protein CBG25262 [Caenorhabditis briggsae]|uniref:Protein CBG25262 n=1 Tax=Caenorhabditis briggsae TaxID=6238 RepID=B6IFN2_CAEBR|nr:Protein CBG25262 [Caenorhabditis briggsae]CAR98712.1 Protein CBG25262 [Caenorhabditis briggsae]
MKSSYTAILICDSQGSSMHHSFDDRPSASSEDLFASCNDIDNAVSDFFSFELTNYQ